MSEHRLVPVEAAKQACWDQQAEAEKRADTEDYVGADLFNQGWARGALACAQAINDLAAAPASETTDSRERAKQPEGEVVPFDIQLNRMDDGSVRVYLMVNKVFVHLIDWLYAPNVPQCTILGCDKALMNAAAPANAAPQPAEEWKVFCPGCGDTWSVPYKHAGKSICESCKGKANVQAAQARQARGEGEPGDAIVAHPTIHNTDPDGPLGFCSHNKVTGFCLICYPSGIVAPAAAPDFYEAAEEAATSLVTAPATPNKLPLTREQISEWETILYPLYANVFTLCNQAVLAIEQEQKIAELERDIFASRARVDLLERRIGSLRIEVTGGPGGPAKID